MDPAWFDTEVAELVGCSPLPLACDEHAHATARSAIAVMSRKEHRLTFIGRSSHGAGATRKCRSRLLVRRDQSGLDRTASAWPTGRHFAHLASADSRHKDEVVLGMAARGDDHSHRRQCGCGLAGRGPLLEHHSDLAFTRPCKEPHRMKPRVL